ncbi:MAG: polysialic acid capsule expression protein [Pseudomonadota bacterium]|jgi:arabinose-5-phosphate isomerase
MNLKEEARKVLAIEAQAVAALGPRIDDKFLEAVEVIFGCQGKVVTTGIGKSGIIARKLASTFSSTGTPSVFLHPAESSHGDLGLVSSDDVIVVFSYRGEADELNAILNYAARKGLKVIAFTGSHESRLGRSSQIILDCSISTEACPLNLAPTASTTAALAMSDALAMAVLLKRGFKSEDFAEYHPGGSLGRKLLRVRDVMHAGDSLPVVKLETPMLQVVSVMTAKEVRGTAGVTNESAELVGVITDGDLRRRLERSQNPLEGVARDIMTLNPKTIDAEEMAEKALFIMEEFRIQMLFVVDAQSGNPRQPVGLIHLQDLLKNKVR